MRFISPYRRIALSLMLVVPAVVLVSTAPKLRTSAEAIADTQAAAHASPLHTLPAASARDREASSLSTAGSGTAAAGAYLGGNFVPAASDVGMDRAAVDDLLADTEQCGNCTDRPRRTRTPKQNQNTPTATPVVQPTNTPVPLPTDTPVVLPTDTPVPSPTNPPPPTWTTVPATATPIPNYHNPPPAVVDAEAEMYQLINAHRASLGLNQWARVTSLDLAQRDWAVQMVATNQCYHGDFGARAAQQGYTGFAWGEVGACGYATAQGAFQGWLNSPGHRAILEAGTDMDDIGIGAWQYPNGFFQFWALVGDSH